jgi:multisubunit Na+/H+ antiporter MnhB subunit
MSSLIVRATARGLTPVMALLSLWLLLRGHDEPGGGFIASLVAGAAVVLQYLASGVEGVRRFLPFRATTLLGIGLLVATGFGLAGLLVGAEFLEGAIWTAEVPAIGEVKVAASLIFDVGVYLVVLAVVMAIVRYLGEEAP